MSLAIEVKDIYKAFKKGHPIYEGLSLKLNEGEVTFLLGPSGSGKSVLLKHILGLLKPDSGEVFIFGQQIPYVHSPELNEVRKAFGVLFQYAALFDDFTVYENVAFPLKEHRRGWSKKEMLDKVEEKLLAVGLDPKTTLEKYPNELSGGMKKRVGLARAIVLEPKILLYDEPTTGLDPRTRAMVDDLIVEMNEKFGLTSFVISHDIPSALYSADQIAFLYDRKIVFFGDPKAFKRCDHPIVQEFLQAEERHRKEIMT